MTKLNDIQLILLTRAAQRQSGSLMPPPASVADAGERLQIALASLQELGQAEEGPSKNAKMVWRTDGDDRFALLINDAGRAAINVAPDDGAAADSATAAASAPSQPKPERQTKAAAVIALLQRPNGATLAEMIQATGWLPHTTRAALTGLRKKGHALDKSKRGEETCYRILAAA
jgi:hypothetical protein